MTDCLKRYTQLIEDQLDCLPLSHSEKGCTGVEVWRNNRFKVTLNYVFVRL